MRAMLVMPGAVLLLCAAVLRAGCQQPSPVVGMDLPDVDSHPDPRLWALDDDASQSFSRPMSGKVLEGQKTPPCSPVTQVAINGGCWTEVKYTPGQVQGCGTDAFEHQGACYIPAKRAQRTPTSVELQDPIGRLPDMHGGGLAPEEVHTRRTESSMIYPRPTPSVRTLRTALSQVPTWKLEAAACAAVVCISIIFILMLASTT